MLPYLVLLPLQVAQQTMDVLKEFILKEREAVKPYVNTLIPAVVSVCIPDRNKTSFSRHAQINCLAPGSRLVPVAGRAPPDFSCIEFSQTPCSGG